MMALVSGLGSNKTVLDLWKQPSWGEVQHSKFSVFFMDDAGGGMLMNLSGPARMKLRKGSKQWPLFS